MRKKTIDTIPILTGRISDILNTFSQNRFLPASLVKRSQIILMAAKGETNQKIAARVGLHYVNVATWRNRSLQNLPNLRELESSAPEKLSDEIINILSDKKRPGPPGKNYLSVEELKESIRKFIEQYNLTAHPFKWTYAGIPLTV